MKKKIYFKKSLSIRESLTFIVQSLVECLTKVNHDDKSAVSQQFRRVVYTRQVLADKDIRLSPRSKKTCKSDITNLCFKSIQQFGQTQLENVDSGISLDGVIIQCLKDRVELLLL